MLHVVKNKHNLNLSVHCQFIPSIPHKNEWNQYLTQILYFIPKLLNQTKDSMFHYIPYRQKVDTKQHLKVLANHIALPTLFKIFVIHRRYLSNLLYKLDEYLCVATEI